MEIIFNCVIRTVCWCTYIQFKVHPSPELDWTDWQETPDSYYEKTYNLINPTQLVEQLGVCFTNKIRSHNEFLCNYDCYETQIFFVSRRDNKHSNKCSLPWVFFYPNFLYKICKWFLFVGVLKCPTSLSFFNRR